MNESQKHLMIVAGEASGDMHAAHLVEAIKKQNPNITFSGLGGEKMRKSGVELLEDLTKIAVVGFVEVLKHFSQFRQIFYSFLSEVKERKPDAVILVDYPGFNLRLAKELKKLGTKVIYYISPQVWAWRENRIKQIKKYTDKMIVIFPFEKDFYAQHGLDVEFVGHPFMDSIEIKTSKESFLQSIGLPTNKLTIGILPGSREKEIDNLLPSMIEAAQILNKESDKLQFLLMKSSTITNDILERHLAGTSLPLKIVDDQHYEGINACDLCMVASGTATLETAILNKPMVVAYKTNLLTYIMAKYFVKIDQIAMANVVAGQKIVPECIQFEATGEKLAAELRNIFTNEPRIAQIKSELSKVKSSLGKPGASERAARNILALI